MTGFIYEPLLVPETTPVTAPPPIDPVVQTLVQARELITSGWTKRAFTRGGWSGHVSYCSLGAVMQAAPNRRVYRRAKRLLARTIKPRSFWPSGVTVVGFNDHPRTRHVHVLDKFDQAIRDARSLG